jgi:hypothetical protein
MSSLFHQVKQDAILTTGRRHHKEYDCHSLRDSNQFLKTVFSHGGTTGSSVD